MRRGLERLARGGGRGLSVPERRVLMDDARALVSSGDLDVAQALVRYAASNHVSMMILGAATHGLQMQRFIDTVPIRVARDAPCTVILVKQALPFEQLGQTFPG